jgi:NAD(P)-dependent dehydrogenase (short-subunit alcohol dehydrogenase family)
MDLGLHGKRALVLGSSSGMGQAIAAGLAAEGASIFVTGRDRQRVEDSARRAGAAGSAVADLTEPGEPERVVAEAEGALGGLGILVGNTGGGRPGGLVGAEMEDVRQGFERMLVPQLAAIMAAIPALRRSGSGRIIVLTARSVLEASPELALSSVFRSGVAAAARSLAMELAPDVTVNVVVPGQFDTGALRRFETFMSEAEGTTASELRANHLAAIPVGRLGRPEEIADLVAFLAGERAGYITGATIRIDGGLTRGF